MNLLIEIYNVIIYQPLFNLLVLLYIYFPIHDFGVTIIVFTTLIKILLYPLDLYSIRSQKVLQEIQPKVQEIQNKLKNDRQKMVEETLALYKKEKINPFAGILPLLIQIPIFIALFQLFTREINLTQTNLLYKFVPTPDVINFISFGGILNLTQPHIILAVLVGICQFIQTKMSLPHIQNTQKINTQRKTYLNEISEIMQKQMVYVFPFLTILILVKLPSALSIYWITVSFFTIFQQYFITLKSKKNDLFRNY